MSHHGPNIVYAHKPIMMHVAVMIRSLNLSPVQGKQQQHRKNQPADAKSAAPMKKKGYLVQSGTAGSDAADTTSTHAWKRRVKRKDCLVETDIVNVILLIRDGARQSRKPSVW